MKYVVTILAIYLTVASCQSVNRPPPPPGTNTLTVEPPKPLQTSPPRPKGCSPGCGPTEICAELGSSYCKGGSVCSVCIKMSSIRFPASALAGMFSKQQQQQQPQPAIVSAQPMPMMPVMQQANPLTYNPQPPVNTYNDPFDIFGFNDPLLSQPAPVQNNMFDLMLLDGMGMGLGFGF